LTKRADNLEPSGVVDRPSPDPTLLSGRVLVVDDDDAYRRIVALRMQSVGCTCHVAGTHAEAVRLLSRHPEIEVAVLDYHMRGEDIALLVRRIRNQRPDVTIVGHSSMERREKFAALGVDRFLLKPWTPDQLWEVLRNDDGGFTKA
jgi:CheY-like chemotaxis protein